MLYDQISSDIMAAMKARDAVRTETLRGIKKEFIEAKTAGGAGGVLTDEAALAIIARMVKKGRDAAAIFVEGGRQDLADEELAQVAVMEEYLPKALTDAEVAGRVKAIIAEVGATGVKDMGRVMKAATAAMAGRAEGKAISAAVRAQLAAL